MWLTSDAETDADIPYGDLSTGLRGTSCLVARHVVRIGSIFAVALDWVTWIPQLLRLEGCCILPLVTRAPKALPL